MARAAAGVVARPAPAPAAPKRARTAPAKRAAAPPLPIRIFNAPFSRALRARCGQLLDALLAGRGWIVLLGLLLAGIVFFNVDLLKLNRDIAATAEQIEQLKRENGRYREQVARAASSERIQEAAATLGLVLPAPGDVRYLEAHPHADPRLAVRRMTEPSGLFTAPAPVTTAPTPSGTTAGTGVTAATGVPAAGTTGASAVAVPGSSGTAAATDTTGTGATTTGTATGPTATDTTGAATTATPTTGAGTTTTGTSGAGTTATGAPTATAPPAGSPTGGAVSGTG